MATRPATSSGYNSTAIYTWSGLLNTDDGAPVQMPDFADRTVQIQGATGTGGTVVIEGSVDGTNYVTLTDPQGNALSFTAVGRIEAIAEAVAYIRPRVTAGDGSTSFVVSMLCRRGT